MPGERQERRRKTISEPEIVHREAMPVILTTPEEVQLRLMGDPAEVKWTPVLGPAVKVCSVPLCFNQRSERNGEITQEV